MERIPDIINVRSRYVYIWQINLLKYPGLLDTIRVTRRCLGGGYCSWRDLFLQICGRSRRAGRAVNGAGGSGQENQRGVCWGENCEGAGKPEHQWVKES